MIEISIVFLFALVAGIIAGLMPGIGMLGTMIICYPFLMDMEPLHLLIFYAVAGGTTQFIGSVAASALGIAAESSSIPACIEGPRLFARGLGPLALSTCSIGSLFGALMISIVCLVTITSMNDLIINFYSNNIQTILFSLVMIIILLSARNNILINVLLCVVGVLLSMVGTGGQISTDPRFTFGIESLYDGIPFITVAMALFAVPQILKIIEIKNTSFLISNAKFKDSFITWFKLFPSSFRGTVIGSVAGLVPGISTILSSNLSYTVEKWLRNKKNTYNKSGDIHSLVSAETANNAGQLTAMLPLFLFGIPIVGSEAVLLNLIEKNGIAVGWNTLMLGGMFESVVVAFLLAGFICLFVAWWGANFIMKIYLIPPKYLIMVLFCCSIAGVVFAGLSDFAVWYYITVFFVLLPFGLLIRKFDTSVLVFSFLVFPYFEGSIYRFFILN